MWRTWSDVCQWSLSVERKKKSSVKWTYTNACSLDKNCNRHETGEMRWKARLCVTLTEFVKQKYLQETTLATLLRCRSSVQMATRIRHKKYMVPASTVSEIFIHEVTQLSRNSVGSRELMGPKSLVFGCWRSSLSHFSDLTLALRFSFL